MSPRRMAAVGAVLIMVSTACVPEPYETALIDIVNVHRFAEGAGVLTWCPALSQAARAHAEDMAAHDWWSDTGTDGSDVDTRAERAGYTDWNQVAETIVYGHDSADQIAELWMAAPANKAVLVSRGFVDAGVGRAESADGTPYWAMVLGRRNAPC